MSVPPRPAATVVLLRQGAEGPETYLCRRTGKATFMPGFFVFPGGRVDEGDGDPSFATACLGVDRALCAIPDLPPERSLAHHVAAMRELFEEAGVLIADRPADLSRETLAACRRALRARERTWRDVVSRLGVRPALDRLHYAAWWTTPESEPRRFTARFFLAALPAGEEPLIDAEELVEERWVRIALAPDLAARGDLFVPPPTLWTLADLGRFPTVEAILAAPRGPVTETMPRIVPVGTALHFLLPVDPGYRRPDGEAPPGTERRVVLSDGAFTLLAPGRPRPRT